MSTLLRSPSKKKLAFASLSVMSLSMIGVVAAPADAAACTATATLVAGTTDVYEVKLTESCDFTVPTAATQFEALLVGHGGAGYAVSTGAGAQKLAGGGGEVVRVDLNGATTWSVQLDPGGDDTTVSAGTTVHTARSGHAYIDDPACGGVSGNDNAGACTGPAMGGGGSGGAATTGDGGAGTVVGSLAAATSLFAGDTRCFGGGGAASTDTMVGEDHQFDSGIPGCGGGKIINTSTDPTELALDLVLPANTGGGAPGSPFVPIDGSEGVVLIRYRIPKPATPTAAPAAPVVSGPGGKVRTRTPMFTGTGQPGATITVTKKGRTLCTTTVDAAGNWACASTIPLRRGKHVVQATQVLAGKTLSSNLDRFRIVRTKRPATLPHTGARYGR